MNNVCYIVLVSIGRVERKRNKFIKARVQIVIKIEFLQRKQKRDYNMELFNTCHINRIVDTKGEEMDLG